jgi:adenylate cyclase
MARRVFSYPIGLAVVVAALIALTGGFIAWWNYRTGVDNVRELAGRMFDQVAREAASETEAFLLRAPPAAATLAGIAERESLPADSKPILERYATVLRANPGFKWVSYSNSDGHIYGAYRVGDEIRVNESKIVDGSTIVDEQSIAADGAWKPIRHDTNDYDPRTRPYYKLAAAAQTGVWTPPYVFAEKVPGVTYALALRKQGAVEGVFTIDFDLARLSELARSLQFSEHGRVAFTTTDGTLLAHPSEPVVREGASAPELVKVTEVADRPLAAATASSGASSLELGGETYLARTVPIQMAGWQVTAYAPESDFTGTMRRRVVTPLVISFVAVVLALGAALLLARRISGPLIALSGEMTKVGKLELEERPVQHSMFREIDMMNTSLAHMKSSLRSFARYVPKDLVRLLLESGNDADLTGEVRELTIFFSDLAGFTSLSETRAPDELVRFLGEYFDSMSGIIMDERGTVDKYMGDGIMAFWGAPTRVENHAARACIATLRCQRRVKELSRDGAVLTTRIGLATGSVLVGNIGSTERMNYTVMGDIANLASRLEGLNKQYGTDSMISEETYEQAKAEIVARPIDVVAVKGKKKGVKVSEVLALASDNDAEAVAIADASHRALEAYLAQRFSEAAAAWDEVLAKRPNDKAASTMKTRSLGYAVNPPERWSGVMIATEK